MKTLQYFILSVLTIVTMSCGNSQKGENQGENEIQAKVKVIYFHGERRCPTCIAVGDIAKQTIEEKYKGNNDVVFQEINIDLKENEEIAKKYEIAGSSLIIDAKGKVENITGMAFQNAKSNPDALKGKIIELVDGGLK
jgi:hypothetical protein